jgi:hypothetical protein
MTRNESEAGRESRQDLDGESQQESPADRWIETAQRTDEDSKCLTGAGQASGPTAREPGSCQPPGLKNTSLSPSPEHTGPGQLRGVRQPCARQFHWALSVRVTDAWVLSVSLVGCFRPSPTDSVQVLSKRWALSGACNHCPSKSCGYCPSEFPGYSVLLAVRALRTDK